MDFGYDAYIQSYQDTMHFFHVQAAHIDSTNLSPLRLEDGGDNAVAEPEDDNDPNASVNVLHENSMQVAAQGLEDNDEAVSYTHLTLPTKRIV